MERLPSFRELFSQDALISSPVASKHTLFSEAHQEYMPNSFSPHSFCMQPSIRRDQYSEDLKQLSRLNCNPYEIAQTRNYSAETRHRLLPHQTLTLEKVFYATAFPDRSCRIAIAKNLGLNPRKVQVWFQNKRQKIRTTGMVLNQP